MTKEAPVQIDVLCPCCRKHFEQDSEQAIFVAVFGECIFCRFSPNSKGSKCETQAELSEIVVKQEVKRKFTIDTALVAAMPAVVALALPPSPMEITMVTDPKNTPAPPPECKTEAEQTAYAFGWWKALESVRVEQPAQRPWVGLTDEEIKPLCDENHIIYGAYTIDFIQSIEAKLKEKNT